MSPDQYVAKVRPGATVLRRMPDGEDLEISCSWCGGTVMAGSSGFIREIVRGLNESGVKVVDAALPVIEAVLLQRG